MRGERVRVAQEPEAVHAPGQAQVRARVRVRGAPDPKPNSDPNPDALGVERCDASELERERIVPRAGEDAAQMPLGGEIFSGRRRVRSARQRELDVAATVPPHHLVRVRVTVRVRVRVTVRVRVRVRVGVRVGGGVRVTSKPAAQPGPGPMAKVSRRPPGGG